MTLILVGFLFVALDVLMNISGMVVELPPDFIGYLLIGMGTTALRQQSGYFDKARSFAWVAAGFSGFLFLLRMLSLSYAPTSVVVLLEVAEIALMAVIMFLLVSAIREKEKTSQLPLYSKVLWWLWIAMMAVLAVSYIVQIVPVLASVTSLLSDLICLAIFLLLWNALQLWKDADEE